MPGQLEEAMGKDQLVQEVNGEGVAMDNMAKRMAEAVRSAKPCSEHRDMRSSECDYCALNMANAAVEAAQGIIDVWMCPGCRMVGATVRRVNEQAHETVMRTGVLHSEASLGCDVDPLRFRGFVPGAITGDKIIWAPVERARNK